LWIVSGDNPQSLKVARYPTRVTAVKLTASPDGATPTQVAVWRSSEVSGAGAPLGLAVARGQLLDSGTTVRIPPEKAGVFLTAAPSDALEQRLPEKPAGQLIVTNVEGAGAPLGPPDAWVGPLDLSPDTRLLLATAARPAGGGFELGVVAAPLGPNAKPPRFVALGTAPAGLAPPLGLGELRIQP